MNGQAQGKGTGHWRDTKRGGVEVTISPEGTVFYGTAQEVTAARLMPHKRHSLAQRLYVARLAFGVNRKERDIYIEEVRRIRREVIREGSTAHDSVAVRLGGWHGVCDAREMIDLQAAARSVGKSETDFVRMCVMAAVNDARANGLRYTRHERRAAEALDAAARA